MEDVAELVSFGFFLKLRPLIGNGNEAAAGFLSADSLCHALEEILFEDIWFERGARFARDDEKRFRKIDSFLESFHLRRVSGVKHVQARKTLKLPICFFQNFGAET